ncbi:MAG: hypothetical protein V4757_10600 [Pseudomonadota bacterium]
MHPNHRHAGAVNRRHVFYIDGFDPKGPAHHHALYRRESARQTMVSGVIIQVGERLNLDRHSSQWQLSANEAGARTDTTYEYLRWDDIVRRHWPRGYMALSASLVRTGWRYLKSGAWKRIAQASPGSQWAAALPVAATLLTFGICVLAGGLGWKLAQAAGTAASLAAGMAASAAALAAGMAVERRVNTGWLTRIYAFTWLQAGAAVPGLEERVDAFARSIARAAQRSDLDEVLVVGYSTGSILAVSALARAARRALQEADGSLPPAPDAAATRPALNLLTLAQCTPILSALPQATGFRQELESLACGPPVAWFDVSSVIDLGAFPHLDPHAFAGVPGRGFARLVSPRFHALFGAQSYARFKRDKRRVHLQYLMAAEYPGVYDYFAITAGGMRLDERLAS